MKLVLLLFLATGFAFANTEIENRIKFIDSELKKIQQRIKDGADKNLVQKYIDQFEEEKKDLKAKLEAQKKPEKKVIAKPKPKKKPKKTSFSKVVPAVSLYYKSGRERNTC
jgi:septal ring factor EnvC (AmiA/AmiB activator)